VGRFRSRHLLGLACLVAAGLIGVAAAVDHHVKQARQDRVEVAEWYCRHLGTRCGGASSAGIEARWNQREVGYTVALSILGATGAGILLAGSLGGRANGALRQPPL
jgi:hypothetical protein